MNIIENVNRLEDYLINESEISLIDIQKISTYLTNIREEAINYTRCSTQLKDKEKTGLEGYIENYFIKLENNYFENITAKRYSLAEIVAEYKENQL